MVGLGIVFVFLDVAYYSARSTGYLILFICFLMVGDRLLDKTTKTELAPQKQLIAKNILIAIIIFVLIGLSFSLAYLWKLGPFGRF